MRRMKIIWSSGLAFSLVLAVAAASARANTIQAEEKPAEDVYPAFAGPGGYPLINSGLLAGLYNENELAGIPISSAGRFMGKWGSRGSGEGQFCGPGDIAVDAKGNVYVADAGNNRIEKSDRNGTYLAQWGTQGSGDVWLERHLLRRHKDIAFARSVKYDGIVVKNALSLPG